MVTSKKVKCYVAPWALSGEGLPIHMMIDPSLEFNKIRITLPKATSIIDYFNVKEYSDAGQIVTINELHTRGFFGFVLTQNERLEEVHLKRAIAVEILKENSLVHEETIEANFYRPYLKASVAFNKMTISDDSDMKTLFRIKVRVFGFGKVHIQTEVDTGEDISVVLESYFMNLIKSLIAKYSAGEEIKANDERFEDPKWILQKIEANMNEMESEMPLSARKESLEKLRDWMKNTKNIGKILEEMTLAVESVFLDLILFQFEKYPAENVSLNYGTPTLFAKQFGGNIFLRLRYWDSMGTEYDPIEIPIEIIDQRSQSAPQKIPLNIEWVREPYAVLGVGESE